MSRTHDYESFENKILKDPWFKQIAWILHAMHYPHSFKMAAAGFSMCPWSGTYPMQFPTAAYQSEELEAEKAFNKIMGG